MTTTSNFCGIPISNRLKNRLNERDIRTEDDLAKHADSLVNGKHPNIGSNTKQQLIELLQHLSIGAPKLSRSPESGRVEWQNIPISSGLAAVLDKHTDHSRDEVLSLYRKATRARPKLPTFDPEQDDPIAFAGIYEDAQKAVANDDKTRLSGVLLNQLHSLLKKAGLIGKSEPRPHSDLVENTKPFFTITISRAEAESLMASTDDNLAKHLRAQLDHYL